MRLFHRGSTPPAVNSEERERRRALTEEYQQRHGWWHSIDVGEGVVTSGYKSADGLKEELASLRLPDLSGRSVLDIGAWDGFYSFTAERLGASRVVALDHFVWSLDLPAKDAYMARCKAEGVRPKSWEQVPELWHPDTLPGKEGFDLAHKLIGSKVEAVVDDFMTTDLDRLGSFDVVLFLGVLYHLKEPITGLERLRQLTRGVAVIESQATEIPGAEDLEVWESYSSDQLYGDATNWWAPNQKALEGMCIAAGFSEAKTVKGISPLPSGARGPQRYRIVVHARA